MKKVLCCGVFNPNNIYTASPYPGDNVFAKGFEANSYEVTKFDYRAEVNPNEKLIEIAKQVEPNIFWFGKAELILPETIKFLRSYFPKAVFCKWAADVRNKPTVHDLGHNEYIDFFFATYGGDYLKAHMSKKMKCACSILAFTDSSYYRQYSVDKAYESNILWTGRRGFGDNKLRNEVIDQLLKYKEMTDFYKIQMFGIDEEWIGDPDYVRYINGAKIGVGINSFNRTLYSSDRLGNYMSCGTFYLAHYFVGIEKCFEQGVHLDWFHDLAEFKEKIDYYLKHDEIRERIARAGQLHVLKHFDYYPLVKNILHVIETGKSLYSWDDVFVN